MNLEVRNLADQEPLLTIRDAAQRLGVTHRTLKYYEERGLLTPSRSDGRYRLYSERDLAIFARILRLKSLGFSLQGITEILKRPQEVSNGAAGYSQESLVQIATAISEQLELVTQRITAVQLELKEAEAVRGELLDDLNYLNRRIAGETVEAMAGERLVARKRRTIP